MRYAAIIAALIVGSATGCVSSGPTDDPFERKFTWKSYLAGDDLWPQCKAGSAAALRLVYNADYERQVRSYDLTRRADGGWALTMNVRRTPTVNRIDLSDPLATWRGERFDADLTAEQGARLVAALERSGLDRPPEVQRLESDSFYWLVGACLEGRWRQNAWDQPSGRIAQAAFIGVLAAFDPSRIALPPPEAPPTLMARERLKHAPFAVTLRNGAVTDIRFK
ncbi:MAG: hypothetical protein FJX46_14010 [Alphaproteobacteria bacterium]|nr:hypothetical protein [Alphaproteobacteria bacterium]